MPKKFYLSILLLLCTLQTAIADEQDTGQLFPECVTCHQQVVTDITEAGLAHLQAHPEPAAA